MINLMVDFVTFNRLSWGGEMYNGHIRNTDTTQYLLYLIRLNSLAQADRAEGLPQKKLFTRYDEGES